MLSHTDILVLDKNSEFWGVSQTALMENAGRAVAEVARRHASEIGRKIVILAGLGNNGGDGFVAARYLSEDCNVKVILLGMPNEIKTEPARENYEKTRSFVTSFEAVNLEEVLGGSDIIIDALLGVGIKGKLKKPILDCVKAINKAGKFVVSVDVPTGLGTDCAVKPALTVTFHNLKEGMNRTNSGRIVVKDIGIPENAEKYVGPGEMLYYPIPKKDSHKGENGVVLVVGGGPYTGAPALSALATYRTGVDLVHIAVPRSVYQIIASYSPNFIVYPLSNAILVEDDVKQLLRISSKVDTVVVGPGLGNAEETKKAIQIFVKKCNKPMVIDASAFDALTINDIKNKVGIVTPHREEFKKLTSASLSDNIDNNANIVKKWARKTKMAVLLKGNIDIISDGKKTKLNRTGNPGMTVGGTGDVLAGIAAGLLAKKVPSFTSASLAAFINGYAGDLVFKEKFYSLLATDVIEKIPDVLKEFLERPACRS